GRDRGRGGRAQPEMGHRQAGEAGPWSGPVRLGGGGRRWCWGPAGGDAVGMARVQRKRREKEEKPWQKKQKKKFCIFCKDKIDYVDYKDVSMLRKFVSDRGKIRARRVSGNCAQHQRDVATAVKNAREMALLPYTAR